MKIAGYEITPPHPVILQAVVGSTVHGIQVKDGIEDTDVMGVCIESPDSVLSLGHTPHFEQYIWRSAAVREERHDARSRDGDLDVVFYSLQKYLRLALTGNPTVLILLFAPTNDLDARGSQLRELAPHIVSRKAGNAFLGYLVQQLQRLTGERGQKNVNRPELVERYGFDTKYAMHALRLGMQGIELLETGRFTLPMPQSQREFLTSVRTGGYSLQEVLTAAGELGAKLRALRDGTHLPDEPNVAVVERWCRETYWNTWKADRYLSDHRVVHHAGQQEHDVIMDAILGHG